MVENYDDISCEDVIYSEDYRDYIKEYFQDFSSIAGTYHPVCIEAIGSRYAVMHLAGDTSMQNILSDYNISMLPALYGLLGTAGLEESGILYFHRSPYFWARHALHPWIPDILKALLLFDPHFLRCEYSRRKETTHRLR